MILIKQLILLLIAFKKSATFSNIAPTVSLQYSHSHWNYTIIEDFSVLTSKFGGPLSLHCIAPYPIVFNVSGIAPLGVYEQVLIRERKDSQSEAMLSFNYFDASSISRNLSVISANIICHKVDDLSVAKYLPIFVTGNQPTIHSNEKFVTNSRIIPCYTTSPFEYIQLIQNFPNGSQSNLEMPHNSINGFYSDDILEGNFTCHQGKYNVNIIAHVSREKKKDFWVFPEIATVSAFFHQTIELDCFAANDSTSISLEDNTQLHISLESNPNGTSAVISLSSDPNRHPEFIINTLAHCIIRRNDGDNIVKTWRIQYSSPPTILHTRLSKGELYCGSSSQFSVTLFQTLKCPTTIQCQLWRSCFEASSCKLFDENLHHISTKEQRITVNDKLNMSAISVRTFFSGMAKCQLQNNLTLMLDYFWGIDGNFYTDIADAPRFALLCLAFLNLTNEIIFGDLNMNLTMTQIKHGLVRNEGKHNFIHYANISTEFFCFGLHYLFTIPLFMKLEYRNGTIISLKENNKFFNISVSDPLKINIALSTTLEIYLPIDAVAVHCIANFLDSSETLVSTTRFETRYLKLPSIEQNEDIETVIANDTSSSAKLICFADGEPSPEYKFMLEVNVTDPKQYEPVLEIFPELYVSKGTRGEAILHFPTAMTKYSGGYKCIARNFVGESEKEFIFRVKENAVEPTNYLLFIFVGAIMFTAGAILIIVTKKYVDQKNKIRNLNETELDEFFKGRPEEINCVDSFSPDYFDFQPYDSQYEIPLSDILFKKDHSNRKIILGSGQFSNVLKAEIKNRSGDVAVKISKQSVGVDMFKAFLYEVKLMTSLGQHEHILSLVGVCTENIKTRSIYIITELCEKGSLKEFLKVNKEHYQDLINDDPSASQVGVFSTLDLLRISAQIATGMEYLSGKLIIHADLAARNVLLTSDLTAKISDLGLSRKLYEDKTYVRQPKECLLPWRWMSPESLSTLTFSIHSDIWSYGVTLFEIFSLGDTPFPNETWNDKFVQRLNDGVRLGRPNYCSHEIYLKIAGCWEIVPTKRLGFSTLKMDFEEMMQKYMQKEAQ